jgi:hypothetical protein
MNPASYLELVSEYLGQVLDFKVQFSVLYWNKNASYTFSLPPDYSKSAE